MARLRSKPCRSRGVSLVEALVALAIMSIGMLALVGVQSTMRLNSDLAKQRTEATRIASEEIERLRSFIAMAAVGGQPGVSYDEIVSRVVDGYQPPDGIGNTSYRVVRTVTDLVGSAQKIVSVQVQWTDRTNRDQTVTLDSAVSATPPTLGAMLIVPHRESASSRRGGRHSSIPPEAVDIGGGYSRFEPPGSGGVGWYFNNLSGVMRVCAAGITEFSGCPLATLVSGVVRYHLADAQPSGSNAEAPQGAARNLAPAGLAMTLVNALGSVVGTACYTVSFSASELATGPQVPYFCAVLTSDSLGWGGQLNPRPVESDGTDMALPTVQDGDGSTHYKSCRYTSDLPSAEDSAVVGNQEDLFAQYIRNAEHPRFYCRERPRNADEAVGSCRGSRVQSNLINQNFLIIRGQYRCPTEHSPDTDPLAYASPGSDSLVYANTRQHQPTPVAP